MFLSQTGFRVVLQHKPILPFFFFVHCTGTTPASLIALNFRFGLVVAVKLKYTLLVGNRTL